MPSNCFILHSKFFPFFKLVSKEAGPSLQVNCFSWNVQSIKNKADKFLEHIEDSNSDFGFITETWLNENKNDVTALVRDKGYVLRHVIRKNREKEDGGGVGILIKNSINHKQIPCKQFTSFEHMMVSVKLCTGTSLILITVYRLHIVSESTFFAEFTTLLESLCSMEENFIMSGDINFHLEIPTNPNVVLLNDLFDSFDCIQYVSGPTHRMGHTLDFVLTRKDSPLVSQVNVDDVNLSDHFFITFQAQCMMSKSEYRTFSSRNLKSINLQEFRNELTEILEQSDFSAFGDKVEFYNTQLSNLLDKHAPLKKRTAKVVPHAPWFDSEYIDLRKKRRKAEKRYKRTKSPEDKVTFCKLRKMTTGLAFSKKQTYFKTQINECPSSKALYSCIDRLLDRKEGEVLPSCESSEELASKFNSFFKNKIHDIRKSFPPCTHVNEPSEFLGVPLDIFRPATLEEIKSIVSKHGLKCSPDDPLPSKLLSSLTDILLPVWLELVNLSLEQGSMECLKSAVVLPLLKGLDSILDSEIFKNYRPVSNLQFLGKLIERIVDTRLDEHIESNDLHCNNQYGYKKKHSTEILLIKIVNDLLLSCDRKIPTLLMLLDLSAAFDTVDQDKMLFILKNRYGVRGVALKWFESFLKGRTQKVLVKDQYSDSESLDFGVAQGSILGPKLFNLYAQSFGSTLESKVNVVVEGYADDHQVQKKFSIIFQFSFLTEGIQNIFDVAESWMFEYFLKINSTKTLMVIVAPPSVLENIVIRGTFINGCCIRFVSEAKNLGVILDSSLSFSSQVKKVVKACFRTLRKLTRIRRFLTKDELKLLACALVLSQLDYCNALYYHLKSDTLRMLQSVQNTAARIVTKVNRFDHVSCTPILKDLHWLKVKERIEYKILTVVHKCVNGNAPHDISSTLVKSQCTRNNLLIIPCYLTCFGERSFAVAGPKLWNSLPLELRNVTDIVAFKKNLKTFLFKKCYYE